MTWRIGSLFSGIGGLELGLERAGLGRVAWQCEVDPWCRAVLAKHWPDATRFEDVRALVDPPAVEVLCGGFPCQPVSVAGRRLAQADDRWLWPEYARLIRVLRPRVIVAENVPGLATAGLGLVLGDLAALGYDAAWDVLSAAAVGAPHIRERLFVVAWDGRRVADADGEGQPQPRGHVSELGRRAVHGGPVMGDTDGEGLALGLLQRCDAGAQLAPAVGAGSARGPVEPSLGGSADGLSVRLDGHRWPAGRGEEQHEWEPPRTLRDVRDRPARLKALGNAVVPQVAEQVGRWALRLAGVA